MDRARVPCSFSARVLGESIEIYFIQKRERKKSRFFPRSNIFISYIIKKFLPKLVIKYTLEEQANSTLPQRCKVFLRQIWRLHF